MPRFSDEWVVDRVLFDYVSGGSCACCGLSHSLFLPNGTNDLITSMTDLETDQMNNEIDLLNNNHHPWPKPLRDQIWSDRVKLKQKLKASIHVYTEFWSQHGTAFTEWLLFVPSSSSLSSSSTSQDIIYNNTENDTVDSTQSEKRQRLQRCLQMSRDEFISFIQQKYQIHSAYMVVLTAVMEQVAHFPETKYPFDSLRSSENDQSAELLFEQALQFDRRSGFTLPILPATSTTQPTASIDAAQILLDRIRTLGDSKLLGRGPSSTTTTPLNFDDADDDDDDDDQKEVVDDEVDDDVDGPTNRRLLTVEPLGTATANTSLSSSSTKCGIPTPSFQSDRRMIRLILARYWADILIQRYNTDEQNGENGEN